MSLSQSLAANCCSSSFKHYYNPLSLFLNRSFYYSPLLPYLALFIRDLISSINFPIFFSNYDSAILLIFKWREEGARCSSTVDLFRKIESNIKKPKEIGGRGRVLNGVIRMTSQWQFCCILLWKSDGKSKLRLEPNWHIPAGPIFGNINSFPCSSNFCNLQTFTHLPFFLGSLSLSS